MIDLVLGLALVVDPASNPQATAPPIPQAAAMRATVRRSDLARSYLLLERALEAVALPAEEREAVNRAVDALTLLYFSGRTSEAIGRLNETTSRILSLRGAGRVGFDALSAQRGLVEPRSLRIGSRPEVGLALEWLVPGIVPPASTQVLVTAPDGSTLLQPLAARIRLHDGDAARAGRYDIALTCADLDRPVPLACAYVTREDPAAMRVRIETALDAIEARGRTRATDLAATRARARLLSQEASLRASLPIDLAALERELTEELAALESGRSPWIGASGDRWRVIRAGAPEAPIEFPVRTLAPPRDGQTKLALVIALHGAGGDEHMFLEAYGHGLIGRLAAEHGFVVACPATPSFMATPLLFDALVEEMIACHDIDPQRIHVVGHSMGAAAAARLASLRGKRIASVALVAGGGELAPGGPPTLLVGAGLDPLMPASRVRSIAEKAAESGCEVEYREFPREGHLLVVTTALPEVVQWLLDRRNARDSSPTTPASEGP